MIRPSYHRAPGPRGPGGWWILPEIAVQLESDVVCPDVAGWRRERCPERPTGIPIRIKPDWVCEVVSPSNAKNDTVRKLQLFHRMAIPHYWIIDPNEMTLSVLRWVPESYTTVLLAHRGELVHAEPFAQVELAVGELFGDDPL
jgi:Uma2 family endonuclease